MAAQVIEATLTLSADDCHRKPSQLLAEHTGLSQAVLKDAMQKGAVWLIRGKQRKRLRRASAALRQGDVLQLNYSADILSQIVPEPELIHDAGQYSVWFKPYGLACQGSRWGDYASINRWIEVNFAALSGQPARPAFLVHRLDRATTGLILIAHSKSTARQFGELFKVGGVDKRYRAIVHGDCSHFPAALDVTAPVEGRASHSVFSCLQTHEGRSLLEVKLLTGRKHQIRQHLSGLGFPIVGDRLYGRCGRDNVDLQLQAVSLSFHCPLSASARQFSVGSERLLSME